MWLVLASFKDGHILSFDCPTTNCLLIFTTASALITTTTALDWSQEIAITIVVVVVVVVFFFFFFPLLPFAFICFVFHFARELLSSITNISTSGHNTTVVLQATAMGRFSASIPQHWGGWLLFYDYYFYCHQLSTFPSTCVWPPTELEWNLAKMARKQHDCVREERREVIQRLRFDTGRHSFHQFDAQPRGVLGKMHSLTNIIIEPVLCIIAFCFFFHSVFGNSR